MKRQLLGLVLLAQTGLAVANGTHNGSVSAEPITGLSAYVGDLRTEAVIVAFLMLLTLLMLLRAIQLYRRQH